MGAKEIGELSSTILAQLMTCCCVSHALLQSLHLSFLPPRFSRQLVDFPRNLNIVMAVSIGYDVRYFCVSSIPLYCNGLVFFFLVQSLRSSSIAFTDTECFTLCFHELRVVTLTTWSRGRLYSNLSLLMLLAQLFAAGYNSCSSVF